MSLDLLVDLVVIIWGFLILIALVLAIVFSLLLFRQVKALSRSIKETMENAKQMQADVGQALNSSKDIFASFKSEKVRSCSPTTAGSNPKDDTVI